MNVFRLAGDMCHVFSIIILLLRLRVVKNAQGISCRTHELFLLVFVTRYLDLFTKFYSLYNSCMKVLYILTTASVINTIRFREPIASTYDRTQDSFLHWKFAVLPCVVVTLFTHLLQAKKILRHSRSSVDLFYLPRVYCHSSTADCLAEIPRSRELDRELHFFHGSLSCVVHSELDLQGPSWTVLSASLCCVLLWCSSDFIVCWLLLLLCQEQSEGRQDDFAYGAYHVKRLWYFFCGKWCEGLKWHWS